MQAVCEKDMELLGAEEPQTVTLMRSVNTKISR